jgi:hypothetical protein
MASFTLSNAWMMSPWKNKTLEYVPCRLLAHHFIASTAGDALD